MRTVGRSGQATRNLATGSTIRRPLEKGRHPTSTHEVLPNGTRSVRVPFLLGPRPDHLLHGHQNAPCCRAANGPEGRGEESQERPTCHRRCFSQRFGNEKGRQAGEASRLFEASPYPPHGLYRLTRAAPSLPTIGPCSARPTRQPFQPGVSRSYRQSPAPSPGRVRRTPGWR